MRSLLLVPVALLLVAADKLEGDAKKLQGMWSVVELQKRGEKEPADVIKEITLEFTGNRFVLNDKDRKEEGTFKLGFSAGASDPTKQPKTMDGIVKDGKESVLFIYEFDGELLKLCWNKPGGARPTKFTGEGTDGYMVLKRTK